MSLPRQLNLLRALLLAVMVGSCAPYLENDSAEAKEMRSKVIPQLIAWAKSDADQLQLGKLPTLRGFEHICYVWEYQNYKLIEDFVGPMNSYFGTSYFGVPENEIAIIAVSGKQAHIAHFDYGHFNLGRGGDKNCVVLKHARLVKEKNEKLSYVVARLRVDNASTSNHKPQSP